METLKLNFSCGNNNNKSELKALIMALAHVCLSFFCSFRFFYLFVLSFVLMSPNKSWATPSNKSFAINLIDVPVLYSLETSKNERFSNVFRGHGNEIMAWNWLITYNFKIDYFPSFHSFTYFLKDSCSITSSCRGYWKKKFCQR